MSGRDIDPRVFLARLPLLRELGAASLERIAAGAGKQRLARGTTLFRQGESPSGFYVVVEGEIRLVAHGARGSRLTSIVEAGRSFGEPVMFLEKPYLGDAVAHTDAVVIRVPKDDVVLGSGRGFEIAQGRLGPGRRRDGAPAGLALTSSSPAAHPSGGRPFEPLGAWWRSATHASISWR